MTPNVSVLLQRWGVSDVIGPNLVQFSTLNMRRKDGTPVGHTHIPTIEQALGRPWWVVHRAHLHEGLATVAARLGASIHTDSQVVQIDHDSQPDDDVVVQTSKGARYTFTLCVGADGVNSVVRGAIHPDVRPEPPTTNCAFRAIVPYEQIRRDPVARELVHDLTMEVWMAPDRYIITYPICGGRDLNLVLSHHRPEKVRATQPDVPLQELRGEYEGFDPRIKRVVDMIPNTVTPHPSSLFLGDI